MKYSVEVMRVREQTIQLNGWAVESNPDSVITYRVEDEAGQPVKAKIVPTRRDDVSQIYYKKIIVISALISVFRMNMERIIIL